MKALFNIKKFKTLSAYFLLGIGLLGCKKFVEVNAPITTINGDNVYESDATATSVLTGIYTKMSQSSFTGGGISGLSLYLGLSADELTLFSGVTNTTYIRYYKNALVSDNSNTSYTDFWSHFYQFIYYTNSAIDGITKSKNLTPAVRQQLLGEAKFIRAFCYFYLVNLYGDVPLVTTTDFTVNSAVLRTEKTQIFQYVISDLVDAQNLLSSNYLKADVLGTTNERTRPNKWAATALLARAYLYAGEWAKAEAQAALVINNSSTFSLVANLNNVFLKNSTEAIWQLQPVLTGYNTQDARLFIIPATGLTSNGYFVYLNNNLLNTFELGDQRKINWINSVTTGGNTYFYSYKYKVGIANAPVTEYLMVLRLAEQYLIRAEARAHQNNLSGATSDLNVLRTRAGLANLSSSLTQTEVLMAMMQERKSELLTEWGHRWLDLKRTSTVDAVMNVVTPQKGGTWNTQWQLYPIVLTEIQRNPNLVQNPGY